jgi:hypothetical protein
MLAAFLFGIGASGLMLLATAEQRSWGPFQPPAQPPAVQRVIVYDVSPPFEPPALHELMTGSAEVVLVQVAAAQVTEEPAPAPASAQVAAAEPQSPPLVPIRVFGVSSNDPGVSAAAATPTPIILRFGIAADSAPGATETPEAGETPASTPEP